MFYIIPFTLNESNSSKNEFKEFFQASQKNMTEFVSSIKNNAENETRGSEENFSSNKVDKVTNESEDGAMFRGSRLEGKFVTKNVINLLEGISYPRKFPFYQKDLNLLLLQTKLIEES